IGNETRDLTIRNCKFVGKNENSLAIRNLEGTQRGAVMNPKITLCEFSNFKNAVNFCQYVTAAEINNNVFSNCEFGVFLQGAKQTKIIGNKFIDSGIIALEKAAAPTSKLILKQNHISSETISQKTISREMIRVREGDIKKHEQIDLRGNVFFGVKIENLTDQQLERFKTTIDATTPSGNLIDFSKFIFK
ncbi:MAG: right-handed parallel beta-helix repeat-containing protein, partial [Clostridia bacterium]